MHVDYASMPTIPPTVRNASAGSPSGRRGSRSDAAQERIVDDLPLQPPIVTPTPEVDLADARMRAPTSPFQRPDSEPEPDPVAVTPPLATEPEQPAVAEPPVPALVDEPVPSVTPDLKLPLRGAIVVAAAAAGIGLALLVHHDPRVAELRAGAGPIPRGGVVPAPLPQHVSAPPATHHVARRTSTAVEPVKHVAARKHHRAARKHRPAAAKHRPAAAKHRPRRHRHRAAAVARPAATSHKPEPGFVTVDARPYATVYIDGRKVGDTPLVRLRLAPGRHRIRGVAADGRVARATVKVVSGRVVRRRLRYRSK